MSACPYETPRLVRGWQGELFDADPAPRTSPPTAGRSREAAVPQVSEQPAPQGWHCPTQRSRAGLPSSAFFVASSEGGISARPLSLKEHVKERQLLQCVSSHFITLNGKQRHATIDTHKQSSFVLFFSLGSCNCAFRSKAVCLSLCRAPVLDRLA